MYTRHHFLLIYLILTGSCIAGTAVIELTDVVISPRVFTGIQSNISLTLGQRDVAFEGSVGVFTEKPALGNIISSDSVFTFNDINLTYRLPLFSTLVYEKKLLYLRVESEDQTEIGETAFLVNVISTPLITGLLVLFLSLIFFLYKRLAKGEPLVDSDSISISDSDITDPENPTPPQGLPFEQRQKEGKLDIVSPDDLTLDGLWNNIASKASESITDRPLTEWKIYHLLAARNPDKATELNQLTQYILEKRYSDGGKSLMSEAAQKTIQKTLKRIK